FAVQPAPAQKRYGQGCWSFCMKSVFFTLAQEVISDNVAYVYMTKIFTKREHYGDRRGTFLYSVEKGNGRSGAAKLATSLLVCGGNAYWQSGRHQSPCDFCPESCGCDCR